MKIYANRRRGPSLTVEKVVGKDIWVLAQVRTSITFIKLVAIEGRMAYYYNLPAIWIHGLNNPNVADLYKSSIAKALRTLKVNPNYYNDVRVDSIRLMDEMYTTEELYELAEHDSNDIW